jgi:hypothetical protein
MARDYQIDETETELRLHVPPPNVAWAVAAATISATASIWFGGICFYLSLALSESAFSFLYCIGYNVLVVVTIVALRVLCQQLAKKEVTFERHVIGIDHRILGVRVRRQWFSVHRVQEWITVPLPNGQSLKIAMRYDNSVVTVAEALEADLWLSLVVRMQRKEFVYV